MFSGLTTAKKLGHRGQAASQIMSLARLERTTSALTFTPSFPIPKITPPVSLHCFCQSVSVSHVCISLCHMFEHLDGKTAVPSTSKGLGKKLVGYQKLPVVNSLNIDCEIP